jgi:hypothetical protein
MCAFQVQPAMKYRAHIICRWFLITFGFVGASVRRQRGDEA